MTEPPQPRAVRTARRRYVTVCALFWLPPGLAMAPLVLLFTERGMALTAIAGFYAAHSLTAAALELPTGGLSDVVGRRPVLAVAGALNTAALVIHALGTTAWLLTLGMVLMGAGRALASGAAEAWYVDTVQACSGPGAELRTGLARGGTATSAAIAAGILLGGALPWLLALGPGFGARLTEATSGAVLPLSVPVMMGAGVEIVYVCYVLTALREPPRPSLPPRSVLRGIPGTVRDGIRLGGRDALIRRILLTAAAAGSALAAIELLMPGRAVTVTGASETGAMLFAALACGGFMCAGLGSHLAPLTARLTGGSERAVRAGLATSTLGLLLLGVTAASSHPHPLSLTSMAIGFALLYLGLGAASPNENDLLHRRVASEGRATALSVQSLAQQSVGALTGVIVGTMTPGPLPWLLTAAVLLAGTLLWVCRAERPLPGEPALVNAAQPVPRTDTPTVDP